MLVDCWTGSAAGSAAGAAGSAAGAAGAASAGAATAGLGAVGGLSITTQQSPQLLSQQIFERKLLDSTTTCWLCSQI